MFSCYIFVIISLTTFYVSSAGDNCDDKPVFTPSSLVVKYGDPTSARCSVCQKCNSTSFGLEISVGVKVENETMLSWTVDKMTEWDPEPMCYYNDDVTGDQCHTKLPVIIYQPPDKVSISFVDHAGPMIEGHQYTLQCTVQNVAPVEKLIVTFYRGQTALGQPQSPNDTNKKPVTETFILDITPTKEDDGVQYWCEAKLELGPEGPQPSPAVTSQSIPATVHYKPQRGPSHPDPITVTEGNPLQLNCSAVANPSPSYTWTLPSGSLPPSSDGVLTINSATSVDKGQYTCSVSNDEGTIDVRFNVDVQVDYTGYIIAAVLILVVLLVIVAVFVYCQYYRHNRMGRYNLKDVFRLHRQHSAVPTTV